MLKTAMDQDEEDEVNYDDDKLSVTRQSKSLTKPTYRYIKRKVEKEKTIYKEDK